jgi:hypothetical protein
VESALHAAERAGARAILCTCSTIGGVAEAAAATGRGGLPVLRVDRPMAAAAVTAGPRIRVLAALASTVGPTLDLIAEEAGGREVTTDVSIVDGAWDRFAAGDQPGYLRLVADAIDGTTCADVIVLAQASMAGAAALSTVDIPVLSSPRLGFQAAARLATAQLTTAQRATAYQATA